MPATSSIEVSAGAEARAKSARAIDLVITQGRALDDAFAQAGVDERAGDAPLTREMAYGALRYFFALSPLVASFLRRPLKRKDSDLSALLLIGAYQLVHMRVAPHAAVNETVAACTVLAKDWAKGLVNGVLRALLRVDADRRRAIVDSDPQSRFNHPAWLLNQLQKDWPLEWQRMCAANDERAPMTLRVNRRKTSRDDYLAKLGAVGLVGAPVMPDSAVSLIEPARITELPGFAEGEVSVQDAAAQYAAFLLAPQAGDRVLDACAAPGGKAAHLCERADIDLLALDIDPARLQAVTENFDRLGLSARIAAGDAGSPEQWWDGQPFDRILLDAPCSGTGVIRRHPDIKLLRRADDIPRLVANQKRLLDALWPLIRPGGKLLYATCSIFKAENEDQISAFLARHTDARAHPAEVPGVQRNGGYQLLPGEMGGDGFYYAYLEKL